MKLSIIFAATLASSSLVMAQLQVLPILAGEALIGSPFIGGERGVRRRYEKLEDKVEADFQTAYPRLKAIRDDYVERIALINEAIPLVKAPQGLEQNTTSTTTSTTTTTTTVSATATPTSTYHSYPSVTPIPVVPKTRPLIPKVSIFGGRKSTHTCGHNLVLTQNLITPIAIAAPYGVVPTHNQNKPLVIMAKDADEYDRQMGSIDLVAAPVGTTIILGVAGRPVRKITVMQTSIAAHNFICDLDDVQAAWESHHIRLEVLGPVRLDNTPVQDSKHDDESKETKYYESKGYKHDDESKESKYYSNDDGKEHKDSKYDEKDESHDQQGNPQQVPTQQVPTQQVPSQYKN